MTLSRLFAEIESSDFADAVNVASGMALAAKVALRHPLVERVRAALPPKRAGDIILGRILEVARRGVDPRFENPYDAALMTYLLLLEEMNQALARIGAADVLLLPSTWWANKVAARIAATGRTHSDAGATPVPSTATNTTVVEGTVFIGAATMELRGLLVVVGRGIPESSGTASKEVPLAGKSRAYIRSSAVGSGARAA